MLAFIPQLKHVGFPLGNCKFLEIYTPGLPGQCLDRDEADIKLSIRYSDNIFPLTFSQEVMLLFSDYVRRGRTPKPKPVNLAQIQSDASKRPDGYSVV